MILHRHYWAVLGVELLVLGVGATRFDIDASRGNDTQFAISAFIENNGEGENHSYELKRRAYDSPKVNRADDGGLYAVSDTRLCLPTFIRTLFRN